MVLEPRQAERLSRPHANGKIIRAGDLWAFTNANQTIEEARRRHDEIIDAAKSAYEAERRRGYEDGLAEAKREQADKLLEISAAAAAYFQTVEGRVVDLVFDAVRQVISGFSDEQRVLYAVRNALQAVRTQKQLALRVHPTQLEIVRSQINTMLEAFPAIDFVDVAAEPRLPIDACVIDSDIGSVEASLSAHLDALRETLQNVFAAPPSKDD